MAGKRFDRPGRGPRAEDMPHAPLQVITSDLPEAAPPLSERPESASQEHLDPASPLVVDSEAAEGHTGLTARRRDTLYRRALAVADIGSAALALALAVSILGDDRISLALIAAMPLVLIVSKVIGLYDRDEHLLRRTTLEEAPALFQVATLYTLLIWLGEDVLVVETHASAGENLGRTQVLGIWGLLFLLMLAARSWAREIVRHFATPERCLVLGGGEPAEQIDRKLRRARALDAVVVGRVSLESREGEQGGGSGPPLLGDIGSLNRVLGEQAVERVIIAPSTADSDQLLGAIRLVKSLGVKVSVLPRLFEVVGSSVKFDDVEGLMLLGVPRFGLSKSSRLVKRSVDVVGSAAALLVCSPLFVLIALATRLTSPGPVLFRQARIGQEGVEFQMLKFRTMHTGADEKKAELMELNEADGLFKITDDPRLTSIGRLTRRWSIDELPQLFNVLRGEMSLVGPRPLVTDDDRRVEGLHRRRLDVRPGMTGIWQVLGSARVPLSEMVKVDYLYGANWSLWLDLKILLRTVPHVLGRRGM